MRCAHAFTHSSHTIWNMARDHRVMARDHRVRRMGLGPFHSLKLS